jgi:hypothetical protein
MEDSQQVQIIGVLAKVLLPGRFGSNWDFNPRKLRYPLWPSVLSCQHKLASLIGDVKVLMRDFMLKLHYMSITVMFLPSMAEHFNAL